MSKDWQTDLTFIRTIAPPPAEPFGVPVDWDRFEQENGFSPPADFKGLVDLYGSGFFVSGLGELEIPQALHPERTFVESIQWEIDSHLGTKKKFPQFEPSWPAFPAPGGWLPLGGTGIGWTVGWLTRGDPDDWWIAIHGHRDGWADEAPIGLVQFVRRWLTGNLGFAEVEPFEPGNVSFLPQTENYPWSGRTCEVTVAFAPTLEPGRFALVPPEMEIDPWMAAMGRELAPLMSHDELLAQVAPAVVRSHGGFGNRGVAEQADVALSYRPREEPTVIEAVEGLASRLGTTITSVTARDGTPGWPAMRARKQN